MKNRLIIIALLSILVTSACNETPVPPEVKEVEIQNNDLWRAGVLFYVPDDYENYLRLIKEAKESLFKERAKLIWFRNYEYIQASLRSILSEGERIQIKLKKLKEQKSDYIISQLSAFQNRIDTLRKLIYVINGERFAQFNIIRAELTLMEANLLHKKENLIDAEKKLKYIAFYVKNAEDFVFSMLSRYQDDAQITEWKKLVDETISESKQKGISVIIVSKLEKRLAVYKNGKPFRSYEIALGQNGLFDKLHSGDYATPEGKYRIKKKLSSSKYYKALLIDYPNQENMKKFLKNKNEGLIPKGVGIGGMIEIHGGGKDSATDGCISLENEDMDVIFDLVDVGTPITIVGALQNIKDILSGG